VEEDSVSDSLRLLSAYQFDLAKQSSALVSCPAMTRRWHRDVEQGPRRSGSAIGVQCPGQTWAVRLPTSNCPMRAPAVFGGSLAFALFLCRRVKEIKEIFVSRVDYYVQTKGLKKLKFLHYMNFV
jgi:hypothetical protein